MKIKKVLFKITAVIMSVVASSAVLSGCNEHIHSVAKWTTIKEENCLSEGQRQGTCTECGDVVLEDVPADSSKHVYGEWEVADPTETEEGKAVKTCTLDASHDKLEVTLPVISSSDYVKSVKTAASPLDEGEMLYTFEHEQGNISFVKPIPARGINTVADAVEVALSKSANVRKAEGSFETVSYNSLSQTTKAKSINDFYFERGDSYTHIKSSERVAGATDDAFSSERWCLSDDEGIWCLLKENNGTLNQDNGVDSEKYYDGMRYIFVNGSKVGSYYGAENFLAGLYAVAEVEANGDTIMNKPKTVDGVTTYSFSFGYVQEYIPIEGTDRSDGLFCKINVSFTLKDTYELDTLTAKCLTYQNSYDTDEFCWNYDNNSGYASINPGYEFDERVFDGYGDGINPDDEPLPKATVVREIITIKQTSKVEAEDQGWKDPDNIPTKNPKIASSFSLKYGSVEITDDYVIENIDVGTTVSLTINDIQPSTADLATVDKPTFWLVTSSGEVEIDYSTINSRKANAIYIASSKTIKVKCNLGGVVTILIKTAQVTKTVKLNYKFIAPTSLTPSVNEYFNGSYTWSQKSSTEVYVGQPLRFTAAVPVGETSSADSSFIATVTSSNASNAKIEDTDNADVKLFTSDTAGTYEITIKSTLNEGVTCKITVTVKEAPSMNTLLSGTYTGSVEYPSRITVTVTFSSESEVKVLRDGETETLSVQVVEGNIVTKHKSGVELGVKLMLNEAYDLVLINPIGFEDITETVILKKS